MENLSFKEIKDRLDIIKSEYNGDNYQAINNLIISINSDKRKIEK